jgi:hypothetical protein
MDEQGGAPSHELAMSSRQAANVTANLAQLAKNAAGALLVCEVEELIARLGLYALRACAALLLRCPSLR